MEFQGTAGQHRTHRLEARPSRTLRSTQLETCHPAISFPAISRPDRRERHRAAQLRPERGVVEIAHAYLGETRCETRIRECRRVVSHCRHMRAECTRAASGRRVCRRWTGNTAQCWAVAASMHAHLWAGDAERWRDRQEARWALGAVEAEPGGAVERPRWERVHRVADSQAATLRRRDEQRERSEHTNLSVCNISVLRVSFAENVPRSVILV